VDDFLHQWIHGLDYLRFLSAIRRKPQQLDGQPPRLIGTTLPYTLDAVFLFEQNIRRIAFSFLCDIAINIQ
jgi:hypothetical protein